MIRQGGAKSFWSSSLFFSESLTFSADGSGFSRNKRFPLGNGQLLYEPAEFLLRKLLELLLVSRLLEPFLRQALVQQDILSVNDGSKTVNYGYDMLGQMIRANDPYNITADGAGTIWVYAYDLGGNILSKTAYTTNTVGTAVKTNSFTYGDAN